MAGFEANAGPLVGRSRETMFLVERLLNAHTACEFVVLRGPGGIGKTALLDLIGQRASSAGFSVLRISMGPEAVRLPFGALISGLRRFLHGHPETTELLRGLRRDLGLLLPEFAGEQPDDPLAAPRMEWRAARANEAICELLRRLAGEQPTLVVIDDLQWADRATLRLVRWMLRQLREDRLVILAAFRDDEPTVSREALSVASLGTTLEIDPLGEFSARRLLATHLSPGARVSVEDATSAIELTAGNPLFVIQAARALSDGLPLAALAGGVDEVLRSRVSALAEELRRTLAAAAIVGQELNIQLVARMLGEDEQLVVPRLRTLHRAGFLRRDDRQSVVRFAHPLVRQAVLQEMLPPERVLLHRRALNVLGAHGFVTESAQLAHHAEAAGDPGSLLLHAQAAAATAESRGAFHEASKHYDQVTDAADRTGEAVPTAILERAAKAWLGAGRASRAASAYLELADRYRSEGRTDEAIIAISHSVRANPAPESIARLQEVIEPVRNRNRSSPALALALATWCHVQAGTRSAGTREVVEASDHALRLARIGGSDDALATALLARGHILANAFDFEDGCALLAECQDVAHRWGGLREEHAAAVNLGSLLTKACRWEEAAAHLRGAIERALRAGAYRSAGQLFARLSDVEQWRGDWSAARSAADDALLLVDDGDPQAARAARYAGAHCGVFEHAWPEVERLVNAELEHEPWAFMPHGPFLALDVRRCLRVGDSGGALRRAGQLHELWLISSDAFYGIGFSEVYVRALCQAGRTAEAESVLAQCQRRLNWLPAEIRKLPEAAVRMQEGYLASTCGDHSGATAHFAQAACTYAAVAAPYHEARALVASVLAALGTGSEPARRAARSDLSRAHQLLARLGSPEVSETEALLRRMRWLKGATRGVALLTRRESEIAALLVQGLTNQQIAEQLVVSRRTVDNALARMFEKANVHTRTALAAELGSGRLSSVPEN